MTCLVKPAPSQGIESGLSKEISSAPAWFRLTACSREWFIDTCYRGLIVTYQRSDNQCSQTRVVSHNHFQSWLLAKLSKQLFSLETSPQVLCHALLPTLPVFLFHTKMSLSSPCDLQRTLPPRAQHAACTALLHRLCMMAHSAGNKTLTSAPAA